jgi:flagellin
MISSLNTNSSSSSSINSFGSAQSAVQSSQKRIASGRKVADAYDDGAAFSVAEGLRGDTAALGAANERLAVGKGMIDVAVKAGQFISSSMSDVKATLIKLSDSSLSERDRANYQAQYNSQVKDIGAFVKDAKYNGVNLLQQGAKNQNIASNGSGGSVTVQAQDLESSVANVLSGADVSSASAAAALLQPGGAFSTTEDGLGSALNSLSSNARSVNNSIKANSSIMDATEAGLGEIVDADLAKEAAMLSAAQAKQQLAGQALSISNQAPQSLLSLFQ